MELRLDPEVPIADTLGALDQLVRSGKVREIGSSNFSVEQLNAAAQAANSGSFRAFVSVQNEFSLLKRDDEPSVLPAAERAGLAYLPYFPLAGGLLSGKYRAGKPTPQGTRLSAPGSGPRARFLNEPNLAVAEKLEDYAHKQGHSLLELAFSWLLSHRAVASVIAGASTPLQVKANAAAANWQLSADDLGTIDALASRART
jgi:aryl-alcohol dehydrogenase-like predicted oxidoreductase